MSDLSPVEVELNIVKAAIRRYLAAERALRDAMSSVAWQKKFPGLDAIESPEVRERVAALDALRHIV